MALTKSPTVTTIALFVVVFTLQGLASVAGAVAGLFVLSPPLWSRPWTLVTSVYAHASPGHLLVNAAALLLPGLVLERGTSRGRYHAFFVTSGAVAGAAEVTVGRLVGDPTGVLGASGAVFAVLGYVLTGNRLIDAVVGVRVPARVQLLAFAVLATAVTVATGAPGVALVAHFTGLFVGLVAGRAHLLRTGSV